MSLTRTPVSIRVSIDYRDALGNRPETISDNAAKITIELGKHGFAVDPEYTPRWSGDSSGTHYDIVLVHHEEITDLLFNFPNLQTTTRCF